jgi:hypothetical protein
MLLVQIEATTRAVAAADEVHRCDAIESVSWERCGLLQRLTRADRPESLRLEVASVIRTPVLEPAS